MADVNAIAGSPDRESVRGYAKSVRNVRFAGLVVLVVLVVFALCARTTATEYATVFAVVFAQALILTYAWAAEFSFFNGDGTDAKSIMRRRPL